MLKKTVPTLLLLLLFVITACESKGDAPAPVNNVPRLGNLVPYGVREKRTTDKTTETVSNCLGNNHTKWPSRSVTSAHSVEWVSGDSFGAGLTIGEGVIPGGVNLETAFSNSFGQNFSDQFTDTEGWTLNAHEGTVNTVTIQWYEFWQPAYLDVTLADGSVQRVDLKYRYKISSEIVSEDEVPCELTAVANSQVIEETATPIKEPWSNAVFMSAVCDDGNETYGPEDTVVLDGISHKAWLGLTYEDPSGVEYAWSGITDQDGITSWVLIDEFTPIKSIGSYYGESTFPLAEEPYWLGHGVVADDPHTMGDHDLTKITVLFNCEEQPAPSPTSTGVPVDGTGQLTDTGGVQVETATPEAPEAPTQNSTTLDKCELVKQRFPQTLESVRSYFALPDGERNFRLIYEGCGAVATGFIFEGSTQFELSVPDGGCIDSYSGAYFSDPPIEESFGGLRVYSGTVRATGVTYRASGCELKP